MKNRSQNLLLAFICAALCVACITVNRPMEALEDLPLEKVKLPQGFTIEVYAQGIKNARSLARGEKGTIFIGTRKDKVHAIVDTDGDQKADRTYVIASGLNSPNGLAFKDGSLYVAEIDKVWRYDNIENNLSNPPKPILISDKFPDKKWHGAKYIAFGPDGKLYAPVGAPCNTCEEKDEIFASITRMNADGSNLEVYAHGVRNSVGFDWHPTTGELWFTNNGRDMMGDDIPADELNRAPEKGMHFGFPYCFAGDVSDPKFGSKRPCSDFTPPAQKLNAHTAALGMRFYTGDMFPESYKGHIIIAEHGSWNRSVPTGYRLSLVKLEGNKAVSYEGFAEGWLDNGKAWGRPVDVLQMPDGALLVSDDFANAVYRISYQ